MAEPTHPILPRPIDAIDRLLGADPDGDLAGAIACFEPKLPADAVEAATAALLDRYRCRWSEYWGSVGDQLRLLESEGLVTIDRERGVVRVASSGEPLRSPLAFTGPTIDLSGIVGASIRRFDCDDLEEDAR